ncbi:hypothetical protein AB1Y20_006492 [Prymnesium parvum]|uniref:Uncharacterized protein n=1 Tax=Prymnesium parvum TaxID=97485 RepID=A0AB34IZT0_PRYPA
MTLLDKQFISPTRVERDKELYKLEDELQALKTGKTTSHQRLSLAQEHEVFAPFAAAKLLDAVFSDAPLEAWQSQFRIYEKQGGVRGGVRRREARLVESLEWGRQTRR